MVSGARSLSFAQPTYGVRENPCYAPLPSEKAPVITLPRSISTGYVRAENASRCLAIRAGSTSSRGIRCRHSRILRWRLPDSRRYY
jgi:hypothetical protein